MNILFSNLSFGRALDSVQDNPDTRGMRLPSWKEDVIIKCQIPDKNSKMTAPYLYVESRFGRVPWKETMIEMFSKKWQLVDISKNDDVKIEKVNKIHKICEQDKIINEKTLKEVNNKVNKEYDSKCDCSNDCKKKCLHECDKYFTVDDFKEAKKIYEDLKELSDDERDAIADCIPSIIMYLHCLGYDFF